VKSPREFRKYHGRHVQTDWHRIQILRHICSRVDGVETISPVRVVTDQQSIDYEFVELPSDLGKLVTEERLFDSLGRLLTRMHQQPVKADQALFAQGPYPLNNWGLEKEHIEVLERNLPIGWLHCDLWHGNVFWRPKFGFLIIDPLPGRFTLRQGYVRGCGAIDLASMHMGLLLSHPLHKLIRFDIERHTRAAEVFIQAYLDEAGALTPQVLRAVRNLSYRMALRFINSYEGRLAWPVALVKRRRATNILNRAIFSGRFG
tara:strand:+ start:465 stop:1244 length:780 start_codon:yes stop_codon:yes gene_type:complete